MIRINSKRTVCRIDYPIFPPKPIFGVVGQNLILIRSFGFRLDNRSDLIVKLSLDRACDDDDILNAAWSTWGEEMPTQMRGSFAFCLVDREAECVFMARDPLGVSPLYYHASDERLIIGSSSKLVRSLIQDSLPVNDLMLADFVAGASIEKEQTFFDGILRLQPGHTHTFTRGNREPKKYWSFAEAAFDPPEIPEETVFRELFDRSVGNCFEKGSTILMLSGGLDSSSIAGSLASKGVQGAELPCISMTYQNTKEWRDSAHLSALSDCLNLNPIRVPSDEHNPLDKMDFWLDVLDGPYIMPGHSVSFRLRLIAKSQGYDVVLCGEGGDEVVSHGLGRFNELAKSGEWISLWRECSAFSGASFRAKFRAFKPYLVHIPFYRFLRATRKRLFPSKRPASSQLRFIDRNFLSESLMKSLDASRYEFKPAISTRNHDDKQLQREALSSAVLPSVLEVNAICSEAVGVETRMPFYNQELIEYSLSLPSVWKLRHGLSRYILRKAMEGDVPASVLSRTDKFDFSGNFMRGLLKNPEELLELSDPQHNEIGRYVNTELVNSIRNKIQTVPDELGWIEALFIWRVAVLSLWLRISGQKISPPSDLIEIG